VIQALSLSNEAGRWRRNSKTTRRRYYIIIQMQKYDRKAAGLPLEVFEALRTLEEYKDSIGAHEFANLAGVAYPIPKKNEPVLLTTKQAAERWGLSVWTVRRWTHEGRLRAVMGTKSWMYKPDAIEGALRYL